MSPEPSDRAARLSIRVRRVVARDGRESSHSTVFCRLQTKTLSVDECKRCDRYQGVTENPTDRESFLMCSSLADGHESLPLAGIPPEGLAASVASVMSPEVVCVRDDVSVDELVLLLVEHGISGVPVVDEAGKLIGVVSRSDLLWEDYDEAEARIERSRTRHKKDEDARFKRPLAVREIMTSKAFSLPEGATLSRAAAAMAYEGVHRVPIVDENGAVVGILSAGDLLAWLARSTGYIVPRRFPKRR
jgi:CBS domain-containing protein